MRPGWVAAAVRARGLARRRLGREGCRVLAAAPWGDAVGLLRASPYGRSLPGTVDLASAQHAVHQTTAWHLRVLAGWLPPSGVEQLRALAAGLELQNLLTRLAELGVDQTGMAPSTAAPVVDLGHLAVAWTSAQRASSVADLRRRLAVTPWGDPGADDPALVETALQLAWARRVADQVPPAAPWARAGAAMVVARERLLFGRTVPEPGAADADALVGRGWRSASTVAELAASVPAEDRWPLVEVADPAHLWRAEVAWRRRVVRDATMLVRRGRLDPSSVVGVVTLLLSDDAAVTAALDASARRRAEVHHGRA